MPIALSWDVSIQKRRIRTTLKVIIITLIKAVKNGVSDSKKIEKAEEKKQIESLIGGQQNGK